jgi:hypothetical protein
MATTKIPYVDKTWNPTHGCPPEFLEKGQVMKKRQAKTNSAPQDIDGIPPICGDCKRDQTIICKRDADVHCLICGESFCGGHIVRHLKTHCVSTELDYCRKDK